MCLVGVGATGGTVAKVLTEAGLNVVALECGPWLQPDDFSADEIKYIGRNYLFPDQRIKPRTRRHDENEKAEIFPFSRLPELVGGGTVHWNTWVPRPMESDFHQRSLHGEIDGASLADWPIGYHDLEPYLTKVEWEFGISGLASANKHEPPRTKDYPCPPPRPTRYGMKFYEACARLGINGYPVPQGLVTRDYRGRRASRCSGFWNLYGDPTQGKSSTLTTFVPEALATGRLDLRADSYVTEVLVGKDGRAMGVRYIDAEGREVEQLADRVVLCATAIETTRLLLLSKSSLFPDGLINSSGLVGKNATFHEYMVATGLFDEAEHDPLYGWSGYYLNGGSLEFYEHDDSRGHIGGCFISASGSLHPMGWACPGRPTWGSALKDTDRDYFNHAMKIGMILHDLPRETNRVDLDPDVKDGWGQPVARITHRSHPNDVAMTRWQIDKNAEILETAGAYKVLPVYLPEMITGNAVHQHGTCRMGNDPTQSVLDKWCRAHDVENLYVFDGSGFPTATGVNPTLTMMANAWRCAEHLAEVDARGREDKGISPVLFTDEIPSPSRNGPGGTRSSWGVIREPVDPDSDERLFFDEHEWHTIEAAAARIIPTDHDPGAREARVIVFIDRYLSGIDYVYASADGSGFLQLAGRNADAWRSRIKELQVLYRDGVKDLDRLATRSFAGGETLLFRDLTADQQDEVLTELSGAPAPEPIRNLPNGKSGPKELIGASDEDLGFFEALALHTRHGFYGDPHYGGNRDHVGWKVIGFPGPESLADTNNGTFHVEDYLLEERPWPYVAVAEEESARRE